MKNKKKSIVDEYYIQIYYVCLVVANQYTELKDLQKKYAYYDGVELEESILEGQATTSICKNKNTEGPVILVKYNRITRNKSINRTLDFINTISHEATHVALDIYEKINQKICYCTPEPFCYLQGYITECIYKTLTKKA